MRTNTVQGQIKISVILDEIEHRAALAAQIYYGGNETNAKSAKDVPALVKALRRAVAEVKSDLRPMKRNDKFDAEITAILASREAPTDLAERGDAR